MSIKALKSVRIKTDSIELGDSVILESDPENMATIISLYQRDDDNFAIIMFENQPQDEDEIIELEGRTPEDDLDYGEDDDEDLDYEEDNDNQLIIKIDDAWSFKNRFESGTNPYWFVARQPGVSDSIHLSDGRDGDITRITPDKTYVVIREVVSVSKNLRWDDDKQQWVSESSITTEE